MTHDAVVEQWTHFHKVLGLTRHMIEQIPESGLDFRPTPETRTTKEILIHAYGMIPDVVSMVATGQYVESSAPELQNKADVMRWTTEQIEKGFATFETLTQAQTAAMIPVWGSEYPAWEMLNLTFQEFLHHRGQITVYLRLLGVVPVSIYGM